MLSLPRRPKRQFVAPGLVDPSNAMPISRRGTILVVDDEEIMREILETLLTREGYEVRVASSGAKASSWRVPCRSTRRWSTS